MPNNVYEIHRKDKTISAQFLISDKKVLFNKIIPLFKNKLNSKKFHDFNI